MSPGTRTLILVRHAKSSWDNPDLIDFDRPLAKRGRRDAPRVAEELARRGVAPRVVLCSPALRTRQTARLMAPRLWQGRRLRIRTLPSLYLADPEDWLLVLRALPAGVSCALAFGHNPGLPDLIARLTGKRMRGFPTAAAACLELPGPWREAGEKRARLAWRIRPKDLA